MSRLLQKSFYIDRISIDHITVMFAWNLALLNLFITTFSIVDTTVSTCSVPLLAHLEFDYVFRHSCNDIVPPSWELREVSLAVDPSTVAIELPSSTDRIRLLQYHYQANQFSCSRYVIMFTLSVKSVLMRLQCYRPNVLRLHISDDAVYDGQTSRYTPIQWCIPYAGYAVQPDIQGLFRDNENDTDGIESRDNRTELFIAVDLLQFANNMQSLPCACDNWTTYFRKLPTCWNYMTPIDRFTTEYEWSYERTFIDSGVFVAATDVCSALVIAACW